MLSNEHKSHKKKKNIFAHVKKKNPVLAEKRRLTNFNQKTCLNTHLIWRQIQFHVIACIGDFNPLNHQTKSI